MRTTNTSLVCYVGTMIAFHFISLHYITLHYINYFLCYQIYTLG